MWKSSRDLRAMRTDIEAQRDLAAAHRRLAHVVHPAGSPQVQIAAGRLVVQTASGAVTFVARGADLVQVLASGAEDTLVAGRLARFEPGATNGGVAMRLGVRGGATTCEVRQVITFRNPP